MFVVEWLFGLFRGPDLRPHGMSFRSEASYQASSWMAFRGCSQTHKRWAPMLGFSRRWLTNSNTKKGKGFKQLKESGTKSDAGSCVQPHLPHQRVHVQVYL
jgi:hypothetical protein